MKHTRPHRLAAWNRIGIIAFAAAIALLYCALSFLRHMHFESGAFDLGLYDQAVWRFSRFLDPYNTVKQRIIFGDHLVLTLPIVGVLFYIWDDVRMLLLFQAAAIAASAIPMFLMAHRRTGSYIAAWTVTILYSLFFGIQYGVYFDFHPILIGVSLLVFLAYAIEIRSVRLAILIGVFGLLTQENMGIAFICLGFCFIFRREFRKPAILLMLAGGLYTVIALRITAAFSPVGYEYAPQLPRSIPSFLSQLFDSEEKRLTWIYSYSWFSFLPLLSPGSLIAFVADVSQYFVTGPAFARMWSPFMHHRAILAVFLSLGLLDVMEAFSRWKRLRVILCFVLLFVAAGLQYRFHFALNKLTKPQYLKEEQWMVDLRTLIAMVPPGISVASQQNLLPHLSHRKEIYLIYPRQHDIEGNPCGQSLCWWLDMGGNPEYLVVDTRPDQWLTQTLETNDHWQSAIANMEKTGIIRPEKQIGHARLYRILRQPSSAFRQ